MAPDGQPRMQRRTTKAAVLPVTLERNGPDPLHRQLYDQLRETILTGRLSAGARLPSTRALARDLGVSRNTVTAAFDQLLAEGYLEGRVGAGSFVTSELPEEVLSVETGQASGRAAVDESPRRRGLSRRGERLAALRRRGPRRSLAFAPGLPDLAGFPFDIWSRLMTRAWRRPPMDLLANTEPAGYLPLRRAIAEYVRTARGVRCTAEQVIVVSGAQQAIGIAAHVLMDEGDVALIEDPGYPGVRGALLAAGARLVGGPVDEEGFDIAAAAVRAPEARLVCVAPSHQFPLGATLSLSRRLALLDWAQRCDGWIVEDDYDSEYRYAGRPLAALQGLDRDGRVVYVGSFSKTMFPSLRLGYMIVPADLTDPFRHARAALDDHPSTVAQPALTAFIEDGYFAAHLRRMRKLYAERQAALVAAAEEQLADLLTIGPADAGMHLVARFTPALATRMDDVTAARRVEAAGISTAPISTCYQDAAPRHGLLLGYAAVDAAQIGPAVTALAGALRA